MEMRRIRRELLKPHWIFRGMGGMEGQDWKIKLRQSYGCRIFALYQGVTLVVP